MTCARPGRALPLAAGCAAPSVPGAPMAGLGNETRWGWGRRQTFSLQVRSQRRETLVAGSSSLPARGRGGAGEMSSLSWRAAGSYDADLPALNHGTSTLAHALQSLPPSCSDPAAWLAARPRGQKPKYPAAARVEGWLAAPPPAVSKHAQDAGLSFHSNHAKWSMRGLAPAASSATCCSPAIFTYTA